MNSSVDRGVIAPLVTEEATNPHSTPAGGTRPRPSREEA